MAIYKNTSGGKKESLILLVTILFLATALRFYYLGRGLGGNDENAMLLYFGYSPLQSIVTNYWDANNHIFHTLLVRVMGIWFGEENSIAIRLPTLLFGLAGLWMIYQIALELFNSPLIARMALLIATVNPTHIHYSQTARGYSLIIFFSAAIILLSLRVLHSEISLARGLLITICGVLSIYTVPTNIYFMFGLGTWVFAILFIPDTKMRFFKNKGERRIKGLFFLKVTVAIAGLTFIAYAPLARQLIDTISNHQIMNDENHWNSVSVLLPAILDKVFPDTLVLFLPLLIISLFYKNSQDHSYQSLPLVIFFLPFVINLLNGVGGYPRNYLYNFPLLVVFMATGMKKMGDLCGRLLKKTKASKWIALGICLVYCIFSVNILFQKYYPSLKAITSKEYSESILKHSQPHDLIAVQNPQNYIYARKKIKGNLTNILNDNRLSGFQLITPLNYDLFEYDPPPRKNIFSIIQRFWSSTNFKTFTLDKENKITRMTNSTFKSLIPDKTEELIQWKIFRGKGDISTIKMTGAQDQIALKLKTSSENIMIAKGSVPGVVSINKPSIAILVWTVKMDYKEEMIEPNLSAHVTSPSGPQTIQVKMGRINQGMNLYLSNNDGILSESNWFLRSSIGIIPPGNYSFSLWLSCKKDQTLIYDEFRLFVIELADKK